MSYPPPPPSGDQPGDQPGEQPPGYQQPGYPPPPPGYQQPGYPPPPPGYGAPGGYGPPPPSGNNQKAIWSLVIGILSVPLGCYACLGWSGIAAIILGNSAKKEIAASGGLQSGEGQAKAGVILGWVGTVWGTLVLIYNIYAMSTGEGTFQYNFSTGS